MAPDSQRNKILNLNETYSINYDRIFIRGIYLSETHGNAILPKKQIRLWQDTKEGELHLETLLFRYVIDKGGYLIGTHIDAEQLHTCGHITNIGVSRELSSPLPSPEPLDYVR